MMITNEISGLRLVIFVVALIHGITGQMMWSSWSRYSACSVTCGSGRQVRQRYCMKSSSSSSSETCQGAKEMKRPCQRLACPKEKILPCNCGCTMQKKSGQIISQLPSRETKSCEWRILVKKGSKISLSVTRLNLKAGWIRVASGKRALLTLLKPGPEPRYPWKYTSDGNVMTLELLSYPDASGQASADTYLTAQYQEIPPKQETGKDTEKNSPSKSDSNTTKSPNVTAIIGITACVVVIILVAVFLAVRRHRRSNESEDSDDGNEGVNLNNEYNQNGNQCNAVNKEQKPLIKSISEFDRMSTPHGVLLKPNGVPGRESSHESEKSVHQSNNVNMMPRMRYPPEYYTNTPQYVHDPNFIRMIPVTTAAGQVPQPMQPIIMQGPRVDT